MGMGCGETAEISDDCFGQRRIFLRDTASLNCFALQHAVTQRGNGLFAASVGPLVANLSLFGRP